MSTHQTVEMYVDPEGEGVDVTIRIGFALNKVNTEKMFPPGFLVGRDWTTPLHETGAVEIDGVNVGYLPEVGSAGTLVRGRYPFEVSQDGVFRVVLMQTNPLPTLPESAEVELTLATEVEARLARVEVKARRVTVEAGFIDDEFHFSTIGESAAVFLRGDEIREPVSSTDAKIEG